ncbi:MAG: methyltransferase domain-containing protein [Porphyromonadaceae bacterium]|nr:methyltransferase domain-containing protein [Porphyromonadaceae bacterium]
MKTYAQKSREYYNKLANGYNDSLEALYTLRFKRMLLDEIVIESERNSLLDVACGNGSLLKMLSAKYRLKGYGIDISEKMIDSARSMYPEFQFDVSSCEETSFQDEAFDAITVSAAYHHFPDVKGFAREAYRLLKPEGRLYIAEIYFSPLLRTLLNPFVPLSKAGDVKFYAPKEIEATFKNAGFQTNGFKRTGQVQLHIFRK